MGALTIFVFFAGVSGFIAYAFVQQRRNRRRMLSQDYQWYKSLHPELVTASGVKCVSCGNSRINARALMRQTYMREHFCVQCGTTLYYSPEG